MRGATKVFVQVSYGLLQSRDDTIFLVIGRKYDA